MFTTEETLCILCPRNCGVVRSEKIGYCGVTDKIRVSRVGLHPWEEPCISYGKGSGTIFFAGCNLRCVYCQNAEISRGFKGKAITEEQLEKEMIKLRDMGAANINLVTATHYSDKIINVLKRVKKELGIPVVYNCGGYERVETVRELSEYVDIFLPDVKYYSPEYSLKYSGAADYFDVAIKALTEMINLKGYGEFDKDGHMKKGVLVRHLVLPSLYKDSFKIFDKLSENFVPEKMYVSIMSQFFPTDACKNYPEINRRVTSLEYKKVVEYAKNLGFVNGFTQERQSASKSYVPDFNYGVENEK